MNSKKLRMVLIILSTILEYGYQMMNLIELPRRLPRTRYQHYLHHLKIKLAISDFANRCYCIEPGENCV